MQADHAKITVEKSYWQRRRCWQEHTDNPVLLEILFKLLLNSTLTPVSQ
jgi:hypothetical protein